MKYSIFFKDNNTKDLYSRKIINYLKKHDFCYDESASFVIVVGGDGTLLRAIHNDSTNLKTYFQINAGNVGFHAIFPIDDLDNALYAIVKKKYQTRKIHLFEFDVNGFKNLFVNELTIYKDTMIRDCVIEICNNGTHTFSGSNITISTPFGSTGYAWFNGGSYIDYELDCYQLLAIGSVRTQTRKSIIGSHIINSKNSLIIKLNQKCCLKYDHFLRELTEKDVVIKVQKSSVTANICFSSNNSIGKL